MADSPLNATQDLIQALTDAQARLWSDWADLATKMGTSAAPGVGTLYEQWQTMGRGVLDGLPWDKDAVSRQVVERMFAGEQMFLQVITLGLGMLRVVAPKIEAGDEWVELLRRYMDQLKDDAFKGQVSWFRPESFTGAAGDVSELWRLYTAEMEQFMGPWVKGVQRNVTLLGEAAQGDRGALGKMLVSSMDSFEASFGRILSAPAIGQSRETTELLSQSFDAWSEMNRAAVEFQTDIINQGLKAWEDLFQELVDMGTRGEKVTSLHQFFDLYVDTAEKAYGKLFSTRAFADVQGRYVDASMEFRKRQRALLDETMTAMDMPGRTEVDQIHRHVHDLRLEVRYMKRDMAALRTELKKARAAAEHAAESASPAIPDSAPEAASAMPAAKAVSEPPAASVAPKPRAKDVPTAAKPKAARKKKPGPGETPKTGRKEG